MNAEFSRRMARVVNSQYFYEGERERSEELFTLRQELMAAQDVHDLSPKSRIVVAKAEKG